MPDRLGCFGLLCCLLLWAVPIAAQSLPSATSPPLAAPDPGSIQQQQLTSARQNFATQNYQQAYELFNAVYQQQKAPSLLVDMCLCQIALGRADDAEQLISQYERDSVALNALIRAEQESLTRCKDLTRRHRLLVQGVQQCNSDKYRDGIRNLAEADRILHAPDLLLNIGLCYIKDRNLADAARACEQFKQEVPTRTEEQNQSLADCEQGVALLRDFNRCLDVFQQRAYNDAQRVCHSVHKTALDEEIRSQSLLRVGYSQARLGLFREAQESCLAYERTRALVIPRTETARPRDGADADPAQKGSATADEASQLLNDCKALVQRNLVQSPLLVLAPPKETPKAWYKRWWVWAVAGTAVGAVAVGLGVGLSQPSPAPDHKINVWDALTQTAR